MSVFAIHLFPPLRPSLLPADFADYLENPVRTEPCIGQQFLLLPIVKPIP